MDIVIVLSDRTVPVDIQTGGNGDRTRGCHDNEYPRIPERSRSRSQGREGRPRPAGPAAARLQKHS